MDGSTLRLAYDELGRRTHRGTPSGAQTAWEYDAAGNVIGADLSGHVMGFRRDLLGREVGRALAPGLAMTSAWDCVHRLVGRTISRTGAVSGAETLVQQRAFGYRQDGNLTRATDHGFGVRDVEVDVMGRVRAVRGLDWNESYDYDGTGRLTSATWPAGEAAEAQGPRTYQGARVSTAGRYRYTYDAQGRTTVRRRTTLSGRTEVWHFTWDAEDRLTDLTTPDGTRWEYRYDPIGRRVAKSRIDDTTGRAAELVRFVRDGPVLAEQAASYADTSVSKTLTWDYQGLYPIAQTECLRSGGPGRRAQGEVDRRFFAVVTDLVGAPTELVAMDGAVAWRSSGTVWGRQAGADGGAGTSGTPLRFPGQYADGESGLHYNHLGYYDPDTATYLTPDPLGLEPSANPYGYVDNPHIGIDPFGLAATYNPVFRNRKEAFTHAKDMAGIPRSAQPVRQWTVGDDPARASYRNYVYKPVNPAIKSPDYNPRGGWGRYYQYETPQGIRVVAEHTADLNAPHPHFHAGMPKDEAITDMTGETYRELQPKHHLYYPAGGCGGG